MGQCSTANKEDMNDSQKNQNLTLSEGTLIRNTWKIVVGQGLALNGTNMMIRFVFFFKYKIQTVPSNKKLILFFRIFLEHKELKPLWRFAKNLETAEQMSGDQLLKTHGEKLFNAIDMVVNNLDEWNTLTLILIQLGILNLELKTAIFPILIPNSVPIQIFMRKYTNSEFVRL